MKFYVNDTKLSLSQVKEVLQETQSQTQVSTEPKLIMVRLDRIEGRNIYFQMVQYENPFYRI